MSRIGNKPILLPQGVEFKVNNKEIVVKGQKGELTRVIPEQIDLSVEENVVTVTRENETRTVKALHGLTRALLQNMVTGVSEGFTKTLKLFGVGFKMEVKNDYLILNLGYSHPIYFRIPSEITMEATQPVSNSSELKISGIDKEIVGLIAAKIRSFRKPEPYKGKGFRYADEHIVRKAGKTAK